MISTQNVAATAERFVVIAISPMDVDAAVVDPALNPNQQNHSINTPSAPITILCPGIAFAFPSELYFQIRGPTILAPTSAQTPPTICTAVDPAKS